MAKQLEQDTLQLKQSFDQIVQQFYHDLPQLTNKELDTKKQQQGDVRKIEPAEISEQADE